MGVVDRVCGMIPDGSREELRCPACGAALAPGETTCTECHEEIAEPVGFVVTHAELHQ